MCDVENCVNRKRVRRHVYIRLQKPVGKIFPVINFIETQPAFIYTHKHSLIYIYTVFVGYGIAN